MTERKITGDTAKSKYREAQKLATKLGLADDALAVLAEGVREFDSQQSAEVRTVRALERVAEALTPRRHLDGSWEYEERRLRRREVYAQELMAAAVLLDDGTFPQSALDEIRSSPAFMRLYDRLRGAGADSASA